MKRLDARKAIVAAALAVRGATDATVLAEIDGRSSLESVRAACWNAPLDSPLAALWFAASKALERSADPARRDGDYGVIVADLRARLCSCGVHL